MCNPPCGAGERCSGAGQCVATAPPMPPMAAPPPAPSMDGGWAAAGPSGADAPGESNDKDHARGAGWVWDAGLAIGAVSQAEVLRHWGPGLIGLFSGTKPLGWWAFRAEAEVWTYKLPDDDPPTVTQQQNGTSGHVGHAGAVGVTVITLRPMFDVPFGIADARIGPAIGVAFEKFGDTRSCPSTSSTAATFGATASGAVAVGPGSAFLIVDLLNPPLPRCYLTVTTSGAVNTFSGSPGKPLAMNLGIGYAFRF
jgi:hypothetical protein